MKFYIAQDDCGIIHLFENEPKRVQLTGFFKNMYAWGVKEGLSIYLNDSTHSRSYINGKGEVDYVYLVDLLGFKRKEWKNGILRYEGISMKEPHKVEIEINVKLLK